MKDSERRLARLETEAQQRQHASEWHVWPGHEDAWERATPEVRAALRRQYRLCGGVSGRPLVRRPDDGGWELVPIALPYGRLTYLLGAIWREQGPEAIWQRLREAPVEEIECVVRLLRAGWSPSALRDGDVSRHLPRILARLQPQM